MKDDETADFPIVGIGASAGGLDAYKNLLRSLPTDTGAAFVLVQHLDPNHESLMADLLARHTRMEVKQAEDDMHLERNTVYVIPPGKFLRLIDHGLFLDEPVKEKGIRLAVDYFFRSMAEVRGERSIGIVLSGTGSDGTLGIQEIKAAGGMVMVQDPSDAEYDGMPRSAMNTGNVDFVLPVSDMGEKLSQFMAHPYLAPKESASGLSDVDPTNFISVLAVLRRYTDYDFNSYKKGTVERRVQRRMGLKQIENLADYVAYMRERPDEVNQLFRDLLIGVTRFFREPEAWESFGSEVVRRLVERKPKDEPIRAWVPGCASGEEAYTLAMTIFDEFDRVNRRADVQVFATDLNSHAIEAARAGKYPKSIEADVPAATLRKYFTDTGDAYSVNKRLRESIVFAQQNVISDPPFSKLDIITCRNLMIYLESDVQQRMIEMFHFALAEGGFLFLGNSETAERPGRLFEALDKPNRIYRRADVARVRNASFPVYSGEGRQKTREVANQPASPRSLTSVDLARRQLLDRFAPAAVLVDAGFHVLYQHGPLRNYFDFPHGQPTNALPEMVVPDLRGKIRTVLNTVSSGTEPSEAVVPHVRREGKEVAVRIVAEPLDRPEDGGRTILVYFQDVSEPIDAEAEEKAREEARKKAPPEELDQIAALEYELQSTREDLQSTIEEMETANEELKSSNEEVMSMNQELQSTNEELETGREELQSLNEELSTVNSQLEDKVGEVEASNNDLTNLLNSTNIAVIFLDSEMTIRRFTPAIRDIMRIIESDVGRPVEDIALRVQDDTLVEDAQTCLETLVESEAEVSTDKGRHLIRRLRPFRTSENRIEGVVVTYTDVTNFQQARERADMRERQQESVAELGRLALSAAPIASILEQAVSDISRHLNVRYAKVLQLNDDGEALTLRSGVGWTHAVVGQAQVSSGVDSQAGYTLMRSTPVVVEDFREERRFRAPRLLTDHHILCGASVIIGPVSRPWGVLGAHEKETGRCRFTVDDVHYLQAVANVLWLAISSERARLEIQREREQLKALTDALPIRFSVLGADERYEMVNSAYETPERRPEEFERMSIREDIGEQAYGAIASRLRAALDGVQDTFELTLRSDADGKERYSVVSLAPRVEDSRITGVYAASIDITDQRIAELESRERAEQYRLVGEAVPYGVWICDPEGKLTYVSDSFLEMVGMTFEEARGIGWADKLAEGTAEATLAAWNACREEGGNWEREHQFIDVNGNTKHVLALARPVRDDTGTITSWAGFNLDITRRKEEEERLQTVSAELDHRVKNILATVSTIARLTGRSAKTLDEYRNSLEARLQSMSAAHQVLARAGWRGMPLGMLIRTELEPYLEQGTGNVSVNGPEVELRPDAAQSLALAFHELTTNAAKHGALSREEGRLVVDWQWNPQGTGGVLVEWKESGLSGLEAPATSGFGTTVLGRVLGAQLGATVDIAYHESGVRVSINLPPAALN